MSASDFAALAIVAERMKLRALTDYATLHRRDAMLSAKMEKLTAILSSESSAMEAGDVSAAAALQRFASIASRRTDQLLAERRALASDLEKARQNAMRAHGRMEAVGMLAEGRRLEQRQQQARAAERSMGGSHAKGHAL